MWIYIPEEFCPSVLESKDLVLASDWRFQLLEQSATLSTKPAVAKSWFRAWKTKPWMTHLFGRICAPSTAFRGVELWRESLEVSLLCRALTMAARVPELEAEIERLQDEILDRDLDDHFGR